MPPHQEQYDDRVKIYLESNEVHIDTSTLNILANLSLKEGNLLFCCHHDPFSLNLFLLDEKNPEKILWRSLDPIWQSEKKVEPKKISMHERIITFHYHLEEKSQTETAQFVLDEFLKVTKISKPKVLVRIINNPILQADPKNQWESWAVFNTAALYLAGKVHFIYRAVGQNGMSSLGYASSSDGSHINKKLADPVYTSTNITKHKANQSQGYAYQYQSGISIAGCEDPRLTRINDRIYMTYTIFDGYHPPRVALTSIGVCDFLNQKWRWQAPALLSRPDQVHKNWVLFPEKIKGKFALLHSLSPEVLIHYFDSLEFETDRYIDSCYYGTGRGTYWDNRMHGIGPPPIKTESGWLVLYHAMDHNDPNKYKIGAMILDENEPTKILYRSSYPLLEPKTAYENEGFKAGVVYTCGAVVIEKQLFVYYGAADTSVCVATIHLNELIDQLKRDDTLTLKDTTILNKPG